MNSLLKHQDIDRSSSIITAAVAQRTNFQPQNQRNNRRLPNQSSRPQAPRQADPGNQQNGRLPRQAVKCQLCQKIGHTADVCRSKSHNHFEAKVNFVSNHHSDANPWILDSGATHHVTTESANLEGYTGNEEVSMGTVKLFPLLTLV
uniref:Putative ovule protein n=1 Tax=Solanum chacoense TaxID=4108 RepID=A0A0V0H6H5_SOLCH